MPTPTRRALRKIALSFVSLSILACIVSASRNYLISNPVGLCINLTTLVFLAAGLAAIWFDRSRPSI